MAQVAVFISGNSYTSVSFLDINEDYTYGPLMGKHGKSIKKFISNLAIDFILVRKNENDIMTINNEGEAVINIKDGKMGYKAIGANPL